MRNMKTRQDVGKCRLAVAALALAAGIGAATAAWDGQSWVYDQSARVVSPPSQETGALEDEFNSVFSTVLASLAGGVDARFKSSATSLPARVSTFQAGTLLIFR